MKDEDAVCHGWGDVFCNCCIKKHEDFLFHLRRCDVERTKTRHDTALTSKTIEWGRYHVVIARRSCRNHFEQVKRAGARLEKHSNYIFEYRVTSDLDVIEWPTSAASLCWELSQNQGRTINRPQSNKQHNECCSGRASSPEHERTR